MVVVAIRMLSRGRVLLYTCTTHIAAMHFIFHAMYINTTTTECLRTGGTATSILDFAFSSNGPHIFVQSGTLQHTLDTYQKYYYWERRCSATGRVVAVHLFLLCFDSSMQIDISLFMWDPATTALTGGT